ncbi:hypothetical protein SNE40_002346 [Patella caerulea]|uniref:Reverse transcriptase domain-containing protein n=1 Tax=Patella caerulea TaxID=87958 RepID=A0AAN8KC11_PATCE
MYDEVRNHLQDLLKSGIITKSHSPWSSNIVLCRKKDNSLRMCVDFRQLNRRTIKDAYALPHIDEILDNLVGAKYFSVLDMKSRYHQVELKSTDKCKTAFTVGPLGFYQFNRMPFGLTNAPATYQRLMEECLGDLHLKICMIYLDDVIIFSDSYEQHLERLQLVFQRFEEWGLKLAPKKCKFFQTKVKYLGHVVSSEGVHTDPEKVNKVTDWKIPTNIDELRSFLGFAGYYRRFIKNFSKIAQPLNELLTGTTSSKTRGRKGKTEQPNVWKWKTDQDQAFEHLKEALITTPVLAYPDSTKSYILHVDASGVGLGAILFQHQDGKDRVIAYASSTVR